MTPRAKPERKVGDSGQRNRGNAGKGRKRGVPNKTTASMRAAWIEAFDKLGGVDALVRWGKTNPDDFYKSATKLIPQDVTSGDKPLAGGVLAVPMPVDADQWAAIASRQQAKPSGE